MVRVGSLSAIDSNVTVVTTTHPPVLQTHPPIGLHTQVIVVADTNTKSQVHFKIKLYINYNLLLMFCVILRLKKKMR